MNTTTIGVFPTHSAAERALLDLRAAGLADTNISYLYLDSRGHITDAQATSTAGDVAAAGLTTGAVVGTLAGLAVANGILPGIGTLFVAGPLAAALGFTGVTATAVAGGVTGAVAGGLIGALAGLGVSNDDAVIYERLIRAGDVLVVARTSGGPEARDILVKNGAEEIREYRK